MAMTPVQQWQQHKRNEGNNAGTTTAKAPAQQWQCHLYNYGKEVSATTAMALSQQLQRDQHNNVPPPPTVRYNTSLSSLHPPPLCRSCR
jgi:hypothetical protein